jgi:rfaE bifunctional protein kinase chain/domain
MNLHQEQAHLRRIVKSFSNLSVTVLGDLVADEFVLGDIARVSREAPVLILHHRESRILPGGGGNAALNLAALGVHVNFAGIVGNDASGTQLLALLKQHKISTTGIVRMPGYVTPTKTRVLASMLQAARQQVVRIDREPEAVDPRHPMLKQLVHAAREFAPAADAMLVSDYGYGAATPRLLAAIRSGGLYGETPVTLDSRYRMTEYKHLTAATPNQPEVEEALGVRLENDKEKLTAAGRRLMSRMELESLVITRGANGMFAFEGERPPLTIPVHGSDQPIDVTGAGDTVIAVLTAALAASAGTALAAKLANLAGGLVVMKRGTATVSSEELLDAINGEHTAARPRKKK